MPRSVNIYVGDRVMTPEGEGNVENVMTWRDVISTMRGYDAVDFNDNCKREVGANYVEEWAMVSVSVKGRVHRFISKEIQILESRDGSIK